MKFFHNRLPNGIGGLLSRTRWSMFGLSKMAPFHYAPLFYVYYCFWLKMPTTSSWGKDHRERNSKKIILLQFLYVDKTDVTICLESHFWTLITDYWRFSSFFKTYNLFQSNWNFILFRMYNEISTIFKLFSCW